MNSTQDLVTKYEMCTSCGLCQSYFGEKKIKLEQSKGFYFPNFKEELSVDQISDFRNICPAINMKSPKSNMDSKFDSIVGNYVSYYNGYSLDEQIRWESSTGGGITSFASFLLSEKYVDGVLHIGKGKSLFRAEPSLSKRVEDIKNNCGSQYMPTSLLIDILKILSGEETIAIIGKPCDIRAIDNLLKMRPNLKDRVFLKISFLCGGIPSITSTYQIIEKLGANPKTIDSLKYRGNGWPGNFSVTDNNNKYEMDYDEAWGENLGRSVPLVCKICFDSVGDSADIVFGDAWKSDENGYPVFNESLGNNLIITRTHKADRLLKLAEKDGYIHHEFEDIQQFRKIQPSQTLRRRTSTIRVKAISISKIRKIKFDKQFLKKISQNEYSLKKRVRFYLGTVKRILAVKSLNN